MKTTIRIFQPWTACLLLICGCLSAFGQSTPNFNVTVTETTASGCGECEPMQLESIIIVNTNPNEPNTIIDPCLNSGTGFLSVIPTSFDVNLDLTDLELDEEMSVTYQVSGKVYYSNTSGGYNDIQVLANGNPPSLGIASMFSYTSYGSIATLSSGDENQILSFDIDVDIIDPGSNTNNFFFFEFIFTAGEMDDNDEFVPFADGKRYSPYLMVPRCNLGPQTERESLSSSISSGYMNVYPNPTTESRVLVEALIPSINNVVPETAQVDLYNLQGQKIMSMENLNLDSSGKMAQKINIEHLAKGIYILKVSSGSYHASSKLIKQ